MRRSLLALSCMLAFGVWVTGCGQKKVTECNSLIEVINRGVESLEQGRKAAGESGGVEELRAMADAMDKVAEDAGKVELTLEELKAFSGEYQGMAKEVSQAARDLAKAAEEKDAKKINEAEDAMHTAVKAEDPLVDRINKFCQAP
jgi:methyl-accepting chemotaxis protein